MQALSGECNTGAQDPCFVNQSRYIREQPINFETDVNKVLPTKVECSKQNSNASTAVADRIKN